MGVLYMVVNGSSYRGLVSNLATAMMMAFASKAETFLWTSDYKVETKYVLFDGKYRAVEKGAEQ